MAAQTVSGAVATREAGPVAVMWSRKTHFAAILPDRIDVKSFLGTAAAALYGNAELMRAAETSPDTLITALMRCAALGHQPGTDEYYLTPRKKKGVPQVLGIEGYRGVIERMFRSGAVARVIVREVCAKDYFRYVEGQDERPVHSFGGQGATGADFFGANGSRDRGPMVGVYGYAQLTTGAYSRLAILNRDDVMAARDAGGYKADDLYSPWNRYDAGKDHPEFQGRSMWWKTAAKRLEPWVPTSAEYRREQLRASAAAAAGTGPPGAPDAEVHDAEVVEDPPARVPDETPAGGPARAGGPDGDGTGHAGAAGTPQGGPVPAGTVPAARRMTAALKAYHVLFGQVPVGDRGDRLLVTSFLAGRQVTTSGDLTARELAVVNQRLQAELEAAGGSGEDAAASIWVAVNAARQAAGGDTP